MTLRVVFGPNLVFLFPESPEIKHLNEKSASRVWYLQARRPTTPNVMGPKPLTVTAYDLSFSSLPVVEDSLVNSSSIVDVLYLENQLVSHDERNPCI